MRFRGRMLTNGRDWTRHCPHYFTETRPRWESSRREVNAQCRRAIYSSIHPPLMDGARAARRRGGRQQRGGRCMEDFSSAPPLYSFFFFYLEISWPIYRLVSGGVSLSFYEGAAFVSLVRAWAAAAAATAAVPVNEAVLRSV